MIYVVATLTVKPETRAEFIAARHACIKETRKETGMYRLRPARKHRPIRRKMVFVEQWERCRSAGAAPAPPST